MLTRVVLPMRPPLERGKLYTMERRCPRRRPLHLKLVGQSVMCSIRRKPAQHAAPRKPRASATKENLKLYRPAARTHPDAYAAPWIGSFNSQKKLSAPGLYHQKLPRACVLIPKTASSNKPRLCRQKELNVVAHYS